MSRYFTRCPDIMLGVCILVQVSGYYLRYWSTYLILVQGTRDWSGYLYVSSSMQILVKVSGSYIRYPDISLCLDIALGVKILVSVSRHKGR